MDVRTISGAAYTRPPVLAASAADIAAPLDGSKGGGQSVPFLSPVYRFDPLAQLAILAFRDTTSGDVTTQIPSEKVVEQYRRNRGESPEAVKARSRPAEPAAAAATTAPSVSGGTEAAATPATTDTAQTTAVASISTAPATAEAAATAGAVSDVQRVSLKV